MLTLRPSGFEVDDGCRPLALWNDAISPVALIAAGHVQHRRATWAFGFWRLPQLDGPLIDKSLKDQVDGFLRASSDLVDA